MLARTPRTPSHSAQLEAARVEYQRANEAFKAKEDAVEYIRAATIWVRASIADQEGDRLTWARQKIAEGFPKGLPRERHLARLFLDAVDTRDDALPAWRAASEKWAIARREESNRLALEMQPAHRTAIKQIASALEALSRGITAECRIREDFLRQSVEGVENRHLPDCSFELAPCGTLSDERSNCSAWARRMRLLGALD